MEPILSSGLMREVDRQTIQDIGIPSLVLMENAGRGVANLIHSIHSDIKFPVATLFCGKGNNGGDGLVIARELVSKGWKVVVILLFPFDQLSIDARRQYDILTKLTELDPDQELSITTLSDSSKIWELAPSDVNIDSILGTGASGSELNPLIFSAVEWMNANPSPTYSVDLPTGLNPDNGKISNTCVKAELTFALGAFKQGYFVNDGPVYTGDVKLIEIGLPARLLNQTKVSLNTKPDVTSFFPSRLKTMHKYDAGHVVIFGGSPGMHGAPVLTAKAGYASGCGMVTVVTARNSYPLVAAQLTDALVFPAEWSRSILDSAPISERMEKADCLVVGPGLGRSEEAMQFVRELVLEAELPVVLDADGLFAFSGFDDLFKKVKAPLILTPHLGEFCRLTGLSVEAVMENPIDVVRDFAARIEQVVILKGPHTLIASPGGLVIVNPTGNTGLATAGTGDVLSGIIASMIAQGSFLEDAAADGVFLHGLAADLAVKETTEYGLTASKLIEFIPAAIMDLMNE